MSQSLSVASQVLKEPLDVSAHNPFESLGFEFRVEHRDDRLLHRVRRRAGNGKVLVDNLEPVEFVLGSGRRGHSYLISRAGYMFESPISWFTQKQRWDLSPSFERLYPPDRVIEPSCLFCHANPAQVLEAGSNHYDTPVFRHGTSIGCERCHGPGELHAAARAGGDDIARSGDDTIVNPRNLEPALREAICQQCHLEGDQRFVRLGKKTFDFRPGLALQDFWSIFVFKRLPGIKHTVGQVEQMYQSRCFRASDGKLGCSTCHDPHRLPPAEHQVEYFRDRCLICHRVLENGGVATVGTISDAARAPLTAHHAPLDDCIGCHMPRLGSADIAHTALTDHSIARNPPESPRILRQQQSLGPGTLPIDDFFVEIGRSAAATDPRDLGVALSYLTHNPSPLRQLLPQRALPLLEQAAQLSPDDATAWEEYGWLLSLLGRHSEAQAAYNRALSQEPEREYTLSLAADTAERLGGREEATSLWRRVVAVNPWIWRPRFQLGRLLTQRSDWKSALAECEAAVRLHPTSKESRILLVYCCLGLGQKERAGREVEVLIALDPTQEKALRSWFEQHRTQ